MLEQPAYSKTHQKFQPPIQNRHVVTGLPFEAVLARTHRCDPVFKQNIRALHRLGPRITGELIAELAERLRADAWVQSRLEAYSRINPQMVAAIGCSDWPSDLVPVPHEEVA